MKLNDYLESTGESVTDFAARVGLHKITVYRYLRGIRFPRKVHLGRIFVETDGLVTPNDFYAQTKEEPCT